MSNPRRRWTLVVGFIAVFSIGIAGFVLALDDLDPTTTWNVTPQLKTFPGERACPEGTTLFQDKFQSVTQGVDEGTFTDSIVIDGITVTVEITTYADNSFDFNIINGVTRQMFVKGDNYLLYQYDPPVAGATNTGPVSYDTGLHDGEPQNPDSPDAVYKDVSHLDFCLTPVYPLRAEKTAEASYDETSTWTLKKSVSPDTQKAFAGNQVDWTWTVDVTESSKSENFLVEGSITIYNDNGFAVPVTVKDTLDDGTVALVSCPATEVPADGKLVCSYTASPSDASATLNTATVTSAIPAVKGATATADVSFIKNVVNGTATVTDTEIGLNKGLVAGEGPWTFTKADYETCSSNPADYAGDGMYSDGDSNTAYLTSDDQSLTADAKTAYTCYAPIVTKDAEASYDERSTWTLKKSVVPLDQDEFAGNQVDWTWTVKVTESSVPENFLVKGTIYVNNPAGAPGDMTVDLTDKLNDGTVATVDCGAGATSITVGPGLQGTCSYTASPDGTDATLNTAYGTFNGIPGFNGTAGVTFVKNVVNGKATVTDTEIGLNENLVAGGGPWTFTKADYETCSSNPADYAGDGMYSDGDSNTAYLTSDDQSLEADAKTTYTCYAPVLSKTVSTATYDQRHDWTIDKTVVENYNSGYPGDLLDWTWTVKVTEKSVDLPLTSLVLGTIDVSNPAGSPGDMTVSLVDKLNDGTLATVDCGEGATSITVETGKTGQCSFTAEPGGFTATLNTATGTFNGIDFTATDDVNFVATVLYGSATVTDTEIGLDKTLFVGEGPWTFTGDDSVTCSSDWSKYVPSGSYGETITNKAYLDIAGNGKLQDDATTTWLCEAGTVDVLKLTNGVVNAEKDWQFALYVGPDGFDGTQVGSTSSTLGNDGGVLDFGMPALRPDTTYSVCELGIPAGWTSYWQVDVDGDGVLDATVVPYNPNADDDPPEDLGNRCVDFGAGTTIPVTVGTKIRFEVDNSFPGGDPRTPGYWKNWNRCTGGGQQYTADANGGWEEGYWLLEDVLDPDIGGGIVWDDILDDTDLFPIDSCALAVDILDKREVGDAAVVGDGKKSASDPLVNLATHLMAAQLNFGAGACTTQDVLDAALAAETLLDKWDFDGTAGLLPKKEKKGDANLANDLAGYLDDYNNGEFCGSTNGS